MTREKVGYILLAIFCLSLVGGLNSGMLQSAPSRGITSCIVLYGCMALTLIVGIFLLKKKKDE